MGDGASDQCSFCGRTREGIRHVLWECDRWGELRQIRQDSELLAALPLAALLCGLALDSFTDRQKKIWMRVQEQCAAILERHQHELCKPHTLEKRAPSQVSQPMMHAPSRMPDPATPAQWSRGSFLDIASNTNLASSHVPWMFSREQYNRLSHWLAGLRVANVQDAGQVPRLSVIELYTSYLLANGMCRFGSGISDEENGAWWTNQLAQFVRGLRSAQGLMMREPLLPATDKGAERLDFVRRWHIPPQLAVIRRGLMIPSHTAVREYLDNWCLMPAGHAHSSTSGAEMWRRQEIGIAHSQIEGGGSLSHRSLCWQWACTVPKSRWRQKRAPAAWMTSFYSLRDWVANVKAQLEAQQLNHLIDLMSVEGIGSVRDMSTCAGKRTKKAKLLLSIADDNERSVSSSNHVGQGGGLRIICALCRQCAPLSHSRVWVKKQCSSDRGGRAGVVRDSNAKTRAYAGQLEEEAAALRAAARMLS